MSGKQALISSFVIMVLLGSVVVIGELASPGSTTSPLARFFCSAFGTFCPVITF